MPVNFLPTAALGAITEIKATKGWRHDSVMRVHLLPASSVALDAIYV